jgi:hypothetical protein
MAAQKFLDGERSTTRTLQHCRNKVAATASDLHARGIGRNNCSGDTRSSILRTGGENLQWLALPCRPGSGARRHGPYTAGQGGSVFLPVEHGICDTDLSCVGRGCIVLRLGPALSGNDSTYTLGEYIR